MKKIMKISLIMIMFVFLLTGCKKQVDISESFSDTDMGKTLLDVLADYEYNNTENPASLTLSRVEMNLENSFKGKAAIIYNKSYDDNIISQRVADAYMANHAKYTKKLIKDYKSVLKNAKSRINKVSKISDLNLDSLNSFTAELESHIAELEKGTVYSLDETIEKANSLINSFGAAITKDLAGQHEGDLKAAITAVERVKNVNLQQLFNAQSIIKTDLIGAEHKEFEALVCDEIVSDYKDIISNQKSKVKVKEANSNENEIFVVLTFGDISQLYKNVYVAPAKNVYDDSLVSAELYRDVSKLKVKHLVDSLKSANVKAIDEYVTDIKYRVEILETIKLELGGKNIIKDYNTLFTQVIDKYRQDMININNESIDIIDNTPVSDIPQLEADMANEAENKIRTLNASVKIEIDSLVEGLLADMENYKNTSKAIDDTAAVEKAVNTINKYYDKSEDYESKALTAEEAYGEFGKYIVTYFKFANAFPVEMRLTVEGKCVFKYRSGTTIDDNDNFTINATSSGENSVRIASETNESMFLSTPKSFGKSELTLVIMIYLVVFVVLFILKRKWAIKMLAVTLLLTITVIVIYPLAFVLGSSFNESTSLASVGTNPMPKKISFIQYERLFLNTDYVKWYANSFKIAVANMILTCTLSVSSAYVYSRFKFKGKKAGLMAMLIIQIFPAFSAMVAIYTLLANITIFSGILGTPSLINSHLGLILVYVAGQIPYNTWLVKGYFDTIPKSLDEAARIDGASNLRTFYEIILPLGMPMVSFVAVTSFMAPWMDYVLPRILLASNEKKTLAIGLFEMILNQKASNQYTMFAAGAILVAVPITIMFSYFQKYIVQGLSAGAVKE